MNAKIYKARTTDVVAEFETDMPVSVGDRITIDGTDWVLRVVKYKIMSGQLQMSIWAEPSCR